MKKKLFKESKLTLDQAKEKYPEWYENKVVKGIRSYWTVKRDLYDWWIQQIKKRRKWSQLWPQIFLYYDFGDLWYKMRFI